LRASSEDLAAEEFCMGATILVRTPEAIFRSNLTKIRELIRPALTDYSLDSCLRIPVGI
jgi:hypothetical protein